MSAAPPGQDANLLGALALAVSDRMVAAVAERSGRSESAAAALSALDQFLGQPSIDRLSQVLGLSQSGTVRLVDRLQHDGLVRRGPGEDGRTTTVALTPAGRRAARRLEAARLEGLDSVLEPLSDSDRRTLSSLIGRVLVGMMREPGATRWMCRLCDLSACGRPAGHCPLEREARARYG
jgi:DNA-binding MarR family transcriptional regulator